MAGTGTLQRGLQKDLKNCIAFLKTRELGSGDLIYVALKLAEGNLSANVSKQFEYKSNRMKLDDVRRGADVPLDVSISAKFTFMLSNFSGDGSGPEENYSLHEILEGVEYGANEDHGQPKFRGTREPWLSAFGCPPYCCDIEIHDNPALECPDTEAIGEAYLLRYFRAEGIPADFSSGVINISGKCHIIRPMVMRCAGPEGTSPSGYPNFTYTREEDAEPFGDVTGDGGSWPDDPRVNG